MVNETHLGPEYFPSDFANSLAWHKKTHAFWAIIPSAEPTLIIFVHGWGGNSITTWEQCLSLLPASWGGYDLIFYGYKSRKFFAENSAGNFLAFLRDFLSQPARWINDSIFHLLPTFKQYERPHFSYDRIVIVAHSLGAVVSRRALLDATDLLDPFESWLHRTRLVLFAPAHNGSPWADKHEGLTSKIFGSYGGFVTALNILAMPSILSLRSDSDTIKNLKSDTEKILSKGYRRPFKATRIVFGDSENVVYPARFPGDPLSEVPPYQERDHFTVCKSFDGWSDPLELIEKALNDT